MRLSFQPLFFLPLPALRWAFEQAISEHLMDTPFKWLFAKADHGGIWFYHKGDEVLWTWPWTRRDRVGDNRGKAPFISLGFSGTGEWGDARYWTLEDLDRDWDGYFEAVSQTRPEEVEWNPVIGVALDSGQKGEVIQVEML